MSVTPLHNDQALQQAWAAYSKALADWRATQERDAKTEALLKWYARHNPITQEQAK